jgi:Tfp pilus assembly protein PilZ
LLQNISSSGVFIKTDKVLSVGQEVAMTFTFPDSKETVMATGEIIRSTNLGIAVQIKLIFKE